ncbi:MAG TPA: antibiotic biosynthesis monooxygenase [Stellaceae bacterium]
MRASSLVLGFLAMALATGQPAQAQNAASGPVWIVTYFEAATTKATRCAAILHKYAETARKQAGNVGFQAFEEIGRPSRFATLEVWRDKAAAQALGATAAAAAYRSELQPLLVGPFEVRVFNGLSLAAPSGSAGRQAVFVLTHVDVFPAGKDQAAGLVKALAEAGRRDPGNLRLDVLQQDGHPNHFTLVEAWRDRDAFDASLTTAAIKDFRQKVAPLEGALYDERLYRALP